MSEVVIKSEGLGKSYFIGHQQEGASERTFRETLMNGVHSTYRRTRDLLAGRPVLAGDTTEEVWVLRDLDFEIRRGEVVGIIGRNGAGKSTLLKILSRITEPTEGRVSIGGRVASLLEVGTGFHPELTGRENIFLNGTVLGMTRAEISRKFDDIVAFSGVERFLDTPVKRYSSGMYVRLAFAIASHLEPEILLIDEVLAVGDMEFQKRCLGRMNDVASEGRTVLFVSHNIPMVSSLCKTCMLLDNGQLVRFAATPEVLAVYHDPVFQNPVASRKPSGAPTTSHAKRVVLDRAWASTASGDPAAEFSLFEPIELNVAYSVPQKLDDGVLPFFHLLDAKGEYVFLTCPNDWGVDESSGAGEYTASCSIPGHFLNDGVYSVSVQLNTVDVGHTLEEFEHHAINFVVTDSIHDNPHRTQTKFSYEIPGVVRPLLEWNLSEGKRTV